MKKLIFLFFAVIVSTSIFIISCDKEPETDTETQTATDNAMAEETVSKMFSTVNHYGINEEGIKSLSADTCPSLSVDTLVAFPRTLTIDFGTSCTGSDGTVRKGKLLAKFSNHWHNPAAGTNVVVTPENYYVNGIKVEGKFTVTYKGTNTYGGTSFELKVENGVITKTNGKTISWNSTETVDWIEGFNNLDVNDDVYLFTGNSNGTNSDGKSYSVVITKALKKKVSCDYIVEVTYEITPEGLKTRVLDFGDGTCDNKATVSIEGIVVNITL